MQKMISLILEDGRKGKVRLIDYLESQVDGRHYVVVGNKLNTSIKVYEVSGNQAIILTPEETIPFQNYLSNSNFKSISGEHIEELYLTSPNKKVSEEVPSKKEQKSIVYYVFDHDILRSYTADMDTTDHTLSNVKILDTWEQVEKEEVDTIVANQQHEEVVYVVYDKMSDMDFFDGKIVLLHWTEKQPSKTVPLSQPEEEKNDLNEQTETVILYVYDNNVVKKYTGELVSKEEETLQISNIKAVKVINIEETFNVDKFMSSVSFEDGAYFTKFEDIYMEYKKEAGRDAKVNVSVTHFLQKKVSEEIEGFSQENMSEETPVVEPTKKEKVIIFEGVQRQENQNDIYAISGVVCTLVSKDPFKVIPEQNGVRTISFEDPNTRTFKDTCQAYQNLYPNTPVYLVNGYTISDGNEQVIDTKFLTSFALQMQLQPGTALTDGKRVLTEEEMAKKRQEELKRIRVSASKVAQLKGKNTGKPNSKKKRNIKLVKKENESRKEFSSVKPVLIPQGELKKVICLSQSFKEHYPIINGVNDDILHNIEKMEQLGHTNEEIVKELNLPYALVDQLSQDIPEIKDYATLPKPYKTK